MKRIFLMISILMITLIFASCGESPASKAQSFSKEYLEKLYTFQEADKIIDEQTNQNMMNQFVESFKPYMTEKGYNNLLVNRNLFLTYTAAWANSCNISAANIKTTLKKEYKEDKYYVYDYSLDVTATPLNGDKEIKYSVTGEITVKQDNDKFLVENYRTFDDKEWIAFARNFH